LERASKIQLWAEPPASNEYLVQIIIVCLKQMVDNYTAINVVIK
jgi:hypothetical protein